MSEIELTDEFVKAIDTIFNSDRNLFINGKAGTGKSFFIKYLESTYTDKNIALVSPTGIASTNIGGSTIHSFFRIDPNDSNVVNYKKKNSRIYDVINSVDILVVDEISMVRADVFDVMMTIIKHNRDKDKKPIKIVLVGDLSQLPPILTKEDSKEYYMFYDGLYFFDSHLFKADEWQSIEFTKIFRQNNNEFVDILNNIRDNKNIEKSLEILNKNVTENNDKETTILTPYKRVAEEINEKRLNEISNKAKIYKGIVKGNFPDSKKPISDKLRLKVDAIVMTTVNNKLQGYVNGTVGKIVKMTDDYVLINTTDGDNISINRHKYENITYEVDSSNNKLGKKVLGIYEQFPLQLAYAITVHKSQGKTLNKLHIEKDKGMFAKGQLYVALSRCTSLEGITLSAPLTEWDIIE